MDKLGENILNVLNAITPYAWILPVVGGAVIFACLAIPSEGTKNFAKKHWFGVIGGTIGFAGCVYLGEWFAKLIVF